jgi:LPS-assembly protein
MSISGALKLNTNWSVNTSTVLDFDRYLLAREALAQGIANVGDSNSRVTLSSISLGLQYKDECTIFSVSYVASGFKDVYNGAVQPSRALLVKLELRTLGEINFSQNLDVGALRDGL